MKMGAVRGHKYRGAEQVQILVGIGVGTRFDNLESVQEESAGTHEQVPGMPSYTNEVV